MTTLGQVATQKSTELGIRFLFLLVFWPLAFVGDWPRFVKHPSEETAMSKLSAWVAVTFWGTVISILATNGTSPLLVLGMAPFLWLITVRRYAARRGVPLPLSAIRNAITRQASAQPLLVGLPLVGLGLSLVPVTAFVGVPLLVLAAALLGSFAAADAIAEDREYAGWVSTVAVAFGVPEQVLLEQADLRWDHDFLEIRNVPAKLAVKLRDKASLDADLHAIDPGLMLDPDSDHSCIRIVSVTAEQAQARVQRDASDGLVIGAPVELDESVPSAVPVHPQPVATVGPQFFNAGPQSTQPTAPAEDSWGI